MNILALDIGTSSIKAAVLGRDGQFLGPVVKLDYLLQQPDADTATIDPAGFWEALTQAARETAQDRQIDGIGLSCLTPCLVLLDSADRPLIPFVTHLDRRARPTARLLDSRLGARFLRETGNRPLPGGISGIFFKHYSLEKPEFLRQVRRYLHLNSWIVLKLTGETAFEPGNACFTGLCTWEDLQWSPEWCAQLGVLPNWLPAIVPGNTTLGCLRQEWANEWGLPQGIPVKIGLADTSSAMLASQMEPGDLLHSVGTTQVLAVLTDKPQPSPERLTRHFGVGESYMHVTHNPLGGVALEWMHRLCFADVPADEYYGRCMELAQQRKTSVELDPYFLGGDRLEIDEKRAAFKNMSLSTDRMDLLAAVLSAMKAGHRQAWSQLGRNNPPRRVFLGGGGSKIVHRLLPEYSQLEVIDVTQASLRGVAKLFI